MIFFRVFGSRCHRSVMDRTRITEACPFGVVMRCPNDAICVLLDNPKHQPLHGLHLCQAHYDELVMIRPPDPDPQ